MKKALIMAAVAAFILLGAACSNPTGDDNPGATNPVEPPDPGTGVSGTIATANWTADTYVSGNVTITGSLTIAPGITVTLAGDTWITIASGAYISAVGTAAAPITFTGATASTYWRQIYFNGSVSALNRLSYCTIRHAGTRASNGYYAIDLNGGSVAAIDHCVVAENLSGGLDASGAGAGTSVYSSSFYGNGGYGFYACDKVAFDKTNSFTKAGFASSAYNDVFFYGDIDSSRTFDITEVPYYFGDNASIGGTLSIEPGVTLVFDPDTWLTVDSSGVLSAQGTAAQPIVFTAATSGAWRQIYFNYSTSSSNELSYCRVEKAGTRTDGYYAIDMVGDSVATFDHCTVADNLSGGLDATGAGNGTRVDSCSFYHNVAYGLRINDNVDLPNTNAYTRVGYTTDQFNWVYFYGEVATTAARTRTFDITEVPYYFADNTSVTGRMNVAAGVTLAFGPDAYLQVQSTGILAAVGTATAPITFTSGTAAAWRQVFFSGSTSTSNQLKYCVIEKGGRNSSGYYVVDTSSSAVVDIENCTIRNNLYGGVDLTSAGSGTKLRNNTFSDNGSAASGPYDYNIDGRAGVSYSGNVADNYKL